MQPLHLSGEHDLTLDDKSRLMVPAMFRKRINPTVHGEGFYLILSPNRTLLMYPELYYDWLVAKQPVDDLPEEASKELDRLNFAVGGGVVEMDKSGRIVLTEKVRRRSGLERDVTVIGAKDRIEIWDRQRWESYVDDALARKSEIEASVRTARRSPQGTYGAGLSGGAGQGHGLGVQGSGASQGSGWVQGPQGSGPHSETKGSVPQKGGGQEGQVSGQ